MIMPSKEMVMRTNIVFRHFNFDRVLESQVLEQVKCLEKQYHDLSTINVVIDKDCNESMLCHIFLRSNRNTCIDVTRTRPSEFSAVLDAFDEVDRKLMQLEKKRQEQIQHQAFRENLLATTRKAWDGG